MRIGLASLDQAWEDKARNLARCEELARESASHGCSLVVFPEMTLTGYSMNTNATAEPAESSESLQRFGALAKATGVHLVFGATLTNSGASRPVNALCHADPSGDARVVYEKIHLFTFASEHESFEPGSRTGVVETPESRIAASICYDLRFPELYAAVANQSDGAVCIASWPNGRVAHWRALLVARAIENQMYMIGVNRIGRDGNGLQYDKSSVVIDPTGSLLEPVHGSVELDVYDVNFEATRRYRQQFPTVRDKRPATYARL
jgi:omega-amidase